MRIHRSTGRATRRLVTTGLGILLSLALTGCVVTRASLAGDGAGAGGLTVWTYLKDSDTDHTLAGLTTLFHQRYPHVPVRYVSIPINEFGPKLLAAGGTGEGPDVIIGNPVADFALLSQAGVYTDLRDRWQHYADRGVFQKEALWKDGGHLYALHWRFNDLGFWYNQDILAKYRLKPPRTVTELESAMARIAADGRYRPLAFSAQPNVQSAWQLVYWLLGDGVNYCTIDSPATQRVLARIDSWRRHGYLSPSAAALGPEDSFQQFTTGKYAFVMGGSWEVGALQAGHPGFRYGSTMVPAGSAGSHASFAGESVGVGAYSAHKDLAWDFLRTATLSRQGQLATFRASGALPTRRDAQREPEVSGSELARPFLTALGPTALRPWPQNRNTLDAQTDLGTVFSSLVGGKLDPAQAARQLRDKIHDDFEEGGGGC